MPKIIGCILFSGLVSSAFETKILCLFERDAIIPLMIGTVEWPKKAYMTWCTDI